MKRCQNDSVIKNWQNDLLNKSKFQVITNRIFSQQLSLVTNSTRKKFEPVRQHPKIYLCRWLHRVENKPKAPHLTSSGESPPVGSTHATRSAGTQPCTGGGPMKRVCLFLILEDSPVFPIIAFLQKIVNCFQEFNFANHAPPDYGNSNLESTTHCGAPISEDDRWGRSGNASAEGFK